MEIDLSKPVRTRNGKKVVIYCTNAPGCYPIHGRLEGNFDFIAPCAWGADGRSQVSFSPYTLHDMDLVNIKEQDEEISVRVYWTKGGVVIQSKDGFDEVASRILKVHDVIASKNVVIKRGDRHH